ncbi:hypothetical protein GQX73_g2021 [Xylaria multiplex]|uniref:BZIP domain-containing protein n=1 Tax=Xylaria multiplex TaxID=323545 RepID=A0A7C8J5Y3_9PEZI|nr:hypothetical protein GQX73_g2021 [Xylaria multiplex]
MQPTAPSDKALKRRAQNAAAQRIYRAKQKQKMRRLEALTIAALASSDSSLAEDTFNISQLNENQVSTLELRSLVSMGQASAGLSMNLSGERPAYKPEDASIGLFSRVHALLASCNQRERQTYHIVVMRERFTIRDVIKYGLIKLGYTMNSQLFESAKHASTRAWMQQVITVVGDVDIIAVLAAGIKLLASFPLPSTLLDGADDEEIFRRIVFTPQSNTLSNRITLGTVSLGSAFFANAMLLGIPINTMMEDEDIPMQPQALQCTKPDLLPTPAQLAIPHHPSFDVIPWPAFRSNICIALAQDPPLIDDGELCLDLMNEGVRCWGSTAGDSLHGRGQGAPWDQRSWEAAPWFLEKWEIFTDGRNGDMWKNSEWWRFMRS